MKDFWKGDKLAERERERAWDNAEMIINNCSSQFAINQWIIKKPSTRSECDVDKESGRPLKKNI